MGTFANLWPAFRQKEAGQRAFLVPASFQLPLAKNNLVVKVAYLGVAYSATLHS